MHPVVGDVTGWAGAALLLAAFTLQLARLWAPGSLAYLLFNLVGGSLLAHGAASRRAYPAVVLNIVWAAAAATSLFVAFHHG